MTRSDISPFEFNWPHLIDQVIKVVAHVTKVIFDKLSEGHRFSFADIAWRELGILRSVMDHMAQVFVVGHPEVDQGRPGYVIVALNGDPLVLVVNGKINRNPAYGPHNPLVVVRSRIDQMPQNLLFRPRVGQRSGSAVFIVQ